MSNNSTITGVISGIFGVLFMAIGLVNTFWGNDPQFGIFIVLLSLLFFTPVTDFITAKTGFKVHWAGKLLIGAFIFWAAIGVGELFDKVDMMLVSFH